MAIGDQTIYKPALTVHDPAPLDNIPCRGLDIVRVACHSASTCEGEFCGRIDIARDGTEEDRERPNTASISD
jgi:hypothetical protein